MTDFVIAKVMQVSLLITASITWVSATLSPASIDPFAQAAKYGFAVLFLFIVLFMLYKEYKIEKNSGRDMSKLIIEMVNSNRKALESATEAIKQQNKLQEKFFEHLKDKL